MVTSLTPQKLAMLLRLTLDHGKTWLNSTSINFTWRSNDTLQIDYDKKLRTFIQEKNVDDITIIFKAR